MFGVFGMEIVLPIKINCEYISASLSCFFFLENQEEAYDSGGDKLYGEQCKHHNIIPITYFKQQLSNKKLSLRYRGMGENSSQAISSALAVSLGIYFHFSFEVHYIDSLINLFQIFYVISTSI